MMVAERCWWRWRWERERRSGAVLCPGGGGCAGAAEDGGYNIDLNLLLNSSLFWFAEEVFGGSPSFISTQLYSTEESTVHQIWVSSLMVKQEFFWFFKRFLRRFYVFWWFTRHKPRWEVNVGNNLKSLLVKQGFDLDLNFGFWFRGLILGFALCFRGLILGFDLCFRGLIISI